KNLGAITHIYNLNKLLDEETMEEVDDVAYLLIIKNGVNCFSEFLKESIYEEHTRLDYDKKYYDTRRNKVLNKLARWNLCFDHECQDADFDNKKGTIISYTDVPFTKLLYENISKLTDDNSLKLEANYYYDLKKTGIGYHGDTERRKVIGIRLGKDNVLSYKWFKDGKQIGYKFETVLSDGDIYIMSEKAVGTD